MKTSPPVRIERHVNTGFEAMCNVFADNLSRRYEPGGVSYAHHWDKKVIDIDVCR